MSLLLVTTEDDPTPKAFIAMSPEEQEAFVESLRARRLTTGANYEKAKAVRDSLQPSVIKDKLDKLLVKYEKALMKVDEALEKAELLGNQVAGLRLQQ